MHKNKFLHRNQSVVNLKGNASRLFSTLSLRPLSYAAKKMALRGSSLFLFCGLIVIPHQLYPSALAFYGTAPSIETNFLSGSKTYDITFDWGGDRPGFSTTPPNLFRGWPGVTDFPIYNVVTSDPNQSVSWVWDKKNTENQPADQIKIIVTMTGNVSTYGGFPPVIIHVPILHFNPDHAMTLPILLSSKEYVTSHTHANNTQGGLLSAPTDSNDHHTLNKADISDFDHDHSATAGEGGVLLAANLPTHNHIIDNVTNLQNALDAKADSVHEHTVDLIRNTSDGTVTAKIGSTSGLGVALASQGHKHTKTDITDFDHDHSATAGEGGVLLAANLPTHNHIIDNVTNLQNALDAKADSVHEHTVDLIRNTSDGTVTAKIGSTSGLGVALASQGHKHTKTDITDFDHDHSATAGEGGELSTGVVNTIVTNLSGNQTLINNVADKIDLSLFASFNATQAATLSAIYNAMIVAGLSEAEVQSRVNAILTESNGAFNEAVKNLVVAAITNTPQA